MSLHEIQLCFALLTYIIRGYSIADAIYQKHEKPICRKRVDKSTGKSEKKKKELLINFTTDHELNDNFLKDANGLLIFIPMLQMPLSTQISW